MHGAGRGGAPRVVRVTDVDTRSALAREIVAAARARSAEPGYPAAYVERVRAATTRLGAVEVSPDDMRAALVLLEQQSRIDVVVPVSSAHRSVGLLKKVLRKLMIFYVRYLGHQVTLLGEATVRFGSAVTDRVERLEEHTAEDRRRQEDELAALSARVDRLERQVGADGAGADAEPGR